MGYSISVKFKNEEQLKNVHDFLLENKELIDSLVDAEGYKSNSYNTSFKIGNDISYVPDKNKSLHLGLDFSSTPFFGWSLFSLLSYKFNLKDSKGNNIIYYDSEKVKIEVVNDYVKSFNFQIYQNSGIPVLVKDELVNLKNMSLNYIAYKEEEYNNKLKVIEIIKLLSEKIDIYLNKKSLKLKI